MKKNKPIKRNEHIQPLSRDHHHTLLLCWKIRKGFSKGVALKRIKAYSDWFFANHVQPHFRIEEQYMFPVLGNDHEMVKRALAEHRRLERLFNEEKDLERSLSLIEEELEKHVRYEERELFNVIQEQATTEELQLIAENHNDERFQDNVTDEFWK